MRKLIASAALAALLGACSEDNSLTVDDALAEAEVANARAVDLEARIADLEDDRDELVDRVSYLEGEVEGLHRALANAGF